MLSQTYLKSILHYDPETGVFTWLVNRRSYAGKIKPGVVAGTPTWGSQKWKYLRIGIDGKGYRGHRLAWFYVHGVWPKGHIDHKNGDTLDNRIDNLRDVTNAQNSQNNRGRTQKSGFRGVYQNKNGGRYFSHIFVDGKQIYLGSFDTKEEASAAFEVAKLKYHGEFARF